MTRFLLPALLLVLAGAAVLLWQQPTGQLDRQVAAEVERLGSAAAGVQLRVGRAHVDLVRGHVLLESLTLANPEGFRNEVALSVGNIAVTLDNTVLDPAQLWLPEVVLTGTVVHLEPRDGQSNLQLLLERMLAVASLPDPARGQDQPQLVIDRLAVEDAIAEVWLDEAAPRSGLAIPDLVLTDIGIARGGLAAEEAAALILRAILQRAMVAAAEPALRVLMESGIDEAGLALGVPASRDAERLRQLLEDAAER